MANHQSAQARRLVQAVREPIGSFSIYIGLLERERQTPAARAYLEAMRASMKRVAEAFDGIDFWLDNGYPRPDAVRETVPVGAQLRVARSAAD